MGMGDYDGNFRYVNAAYQDILGWSVEEFTSVPWWEFLHPDERNGLVSAAHQLMADGRARSEDTVRMLCREGCYKRIRWQTAVDREQRVFYCIGFPLGPAPSGDEPVAVSSWMWDVAGGTVTCSPELAKRLALGAGPTTTATTFLHRLHPDDRSRVRLRALDSLMTDERFAEDFRLLHPDGTVRWVHAAGRRHDSTGQVNGLHGIAVDITDSHNHNRGQQ
jgi:PAS domain S-box-containing protein